MFDTHVTVTGNALTAPEWRRTRNNTLLANFKIASTSRKYDQATGRWVDGESFRVRVTCWRRLAEGVCTSVMVGDPLVVHGRLYTRDWVDDNKEHRVTYELEALSVGHDLSKGRARFERRRAQSTSSIEDAEADTRVAGEPTVPDSELNARLGRTGDGTEDDGYAEDFDRFPPADPSADEAVHALREAGLDTDPLAVLDDHAFASTTLDEPRRDGGGDTGTGDGDEDASDGPGAGVDASAEDGAERDPETTGTRGRGRRPRTRQPVPA